MNSTDDDAVINEVLSLIQYDHSEAFRLVQKLILNRPSFSKAYCARGILRQATGDIDQALLDYEKAISLDSRYARAIFNKGVVYYEKKEFLAAIVEFDTAIAIQPEMRFFFQRGRANLELENFPNAIADFSHCVALSPSHALPFLFRGVVRARLRNFEEALKDLDEGIKRDADNSDLYLWKASTLIKLNCIEEALATINTATEKGLTSAELQFQKQAALDKNKLPGAKNESDTLKTESKSPE